ncbi:MAG: hypothetical protein V9E96_16450 [Chitinophagaceae bacterium]
MTGFGGSFTQSTAYLMYKLSAANRKKIIDAYFSENGANYSLTRTHINSCDFSVHINTLTTQLMAIQPYNNLILVKI